MKEKKIRPTKINLKIDMRLFYPTVFNQIEKNALYSHRLISEHDILTLLDPFIHYLFKNTPYLYCDYNFTLSHINSYYERETFIEVFDDLFLLFRDFINSYGIGVESNYIVTREDNFIVHIKECESEKEIENIYARHYSFMENF